MVRIWHGKSWFKNLEFSLWGPLMTASGVYKQTNYSVVIVVVMVIIIFIAINITNITITWIIVIIIIFVICIDCFDI